MMASELGLEESSCCARVNVYSLEFSLVVWKHVAKSGHPNRTTSLNAWNNHHFYFLIAGAGWRVDFSWQDVVEELLAKNADPLQTTIVL